MNTRTKLGAAVLSIAALAAITTGTAAQAGPHHEDHAGSAMAASTNLRATAQLRQLNRSGAHGVATVRLHGNRAEVTVVATGLLAGAPHAMHIHAGTEGRCPTGRADTNDDGFVSVTEGHPFYGHIVTSLTTRGDTSPASGLAIDRFPTAPHRAVVYKRTVPISNAVAVAIARHNAVIVVHGVDRNHSGAYDGKIKSDLDPTLPMEATAPAACGTLH